MCSAHNYENYVTVGIYFNSLFFGHWFFYSDGLFGATNNLQSPLFTLRKRRKINLHATSCCVNWHFLFNSASNAKHFHPDEKLLPVQCMAILKVHCWTRDSNPGPQDWKSPTLITLPYTGNNFVYPLTQFLHLSWQLSSRFFVW